jgi:hypothetical protein
MHVLCGEGGCLLRPYCLGKLGPPGPVSSVLGYVCYDEIGVLRVSMRWDLCEFVAFWGWVWGAKGSVMGFSGGGCEVGVIW